MGLTVHWKFKFKGSEDEAESVLKKIQDRIEHDLPHVKMFDLVKLDLSRGYEAVDQDYRWAAIQYRSHEKTEDPQGTFFHFTINPDPGCESMNIGLVNKTGTDWWSGHAFCKTCYSQDFVKAHLSVIHALDICNEEGILMSAADEGDYFETRDIKKLTDNVEEGNAMIAKLFMALKTSSIASGDEIQVQAPIESMINENRSN